MSPPIASDTTPSHDDAATQDPSSGGVPAALAPAEPSPLPYKLGRYHVLGQLGAGGMGVVLTAYDPDLDRKVALKLLRPGGAAGSTGRLLREAHALARLSHPNVVQIYDTGAVDGRVFIAMELVDGVDLRGWLARPRPLAELLRVFLDAARGLAAAHDAGFVHRDFKPDNVLVGSDGRARVADFGLVRQHDEQPESAAPSSPGGALDRSLTRTGAQLGTPAYMSPEQHLGLPADARSDQFSFCVALWEALHGQRPFAGDTAEQMTTSVLSGQVQPPPRSSRAPRDLTRLLLRGMARAPEQRYPDMHALIVVLARDRARTRRRWLFGTAVVGVIAATAWTMRSEAFEPCAGGPDELAATWNPERRLAVAAALDATAEPALATLVLTGLDAYTNSWIASHRDACLDHRRGEDSSDLLDARMRCLDRRRHTLATATALLERPRDAADDPDASAAAPPPDAAQLVARLPAVAACDDPAVVLSEAAMPEDPAVAGEVAALQARLIAARVRHDAGDIAAALRIAETAVSQARRTQFDPILAEALLVQARIQFTRGIFLPTRPTLVEALTRAMAARRDDLAAEASARLLYVDGVQGGQPAEALRHAHVALAMAERAPEPHAARGLYYNNLSGVHMLAHDRASALRSARRGAEETQVAPNHDPIELAGTLINVASMTEAVDERRAGFARAIDLLTTHLGPRHPFTLMARTHSTLFAADLRDGVAELAATCPEFLRLPGGAPLQCKYCFYRMGLYRLFLGEVPDALVNAGQVLECRADHPETWMDANAKDKALALVAVHSGRAQDALDILTRARARIEPQLHMVWVSHELAALDLLRGRALLQVGRPAQAAAALETTLPIFAAFATDHPQLAARLELAEARQLLARALLAASPADPERAAELDAAARTTFVALAATPP